MTYQPAYPSLLPPGAVELLQQLMAKQTWTLQGFKVLVNGETLSVPARITCDHRLLRAMITASTDADEHRLMLCFGTRHHDGYFREECLRQLLGMDRRWVIPFVVELLGEYVLEVIEPIAVAITQVDPASIAAFARENPDHLVRTRRRATSYWDCFYRASFPTLQDYPGITALRAVERIARGRLPLV